MFDPVIANRRRCCIGPLGTRVSRRPGSVSEAQRQSVSGLMRVSVIEDAGTRDWRGPAGRPPLTVNMTTSSPIAFSTVTMVMGYFDLNMRHRQAMLFEREVTDI